MSAACAAMDTQATPLSSEAPEVMGVSPDLEVDSMVEFSIRPGAAKQYGVIRWIGQPAGSSNKNLIAGIELVRGTHKQQGASS